MNGNIRNRGYNILFSKKSQSVEHFPFMGKRISTYTHELPWWLSGEESACQCRRLGFSPWDGKIPWRRKWQPTPVCLPGKSHGQKSLAGCSLWGGKSQTQLSLLNNNNIHPCVQTCALTHVWHFFKRIYLELASSEGEILKVWGKVY